MARTRRNEAASARTIELRINQHDAQRGLVRDERSGDWRTDVYMWHGLVELRWDGKSLFTVVMAQAKDDGHSEETCKKWAAILNAGAADLVRSDLLSAFEINKVRDEILPEPRSDALVIAVAPPTLFLSRLSEEYEIDQLARKSFEFALRKLNAYADYPPSHGISSDGPAMFRYLENCLTAGYLGTMGAWYKEKMSGIERCIADLARRKNRSHAGFRESQEYMRRNLSLFSAPKAWTKRPPTLDPKRMAVGASE